jgi:hypothetical protein
MHVKITLQRFVTENVRDINLMPDISRGEWSKQKTGKNDKINNFQPYFHFQNPFLFL